MTEADLDALLDRAARRLRAQHALRAGLATLGLSLLALAVVLFAVRILPAGAPRPGLERALTLAAAGVPLGATLIALLLSYLYTRPHLDAVALLLDERARTGEHLVTWRQLRAQADATPIQLEFRKAQCAATLGIARQLDPRRLLPMRWPAWSRAPWLAALLLLCALLMPQQSVAPVAANPTRAPGAESLTQRIAMPGELTETRPGTPRVQVLAPTELLRLQLLATDPQAVPEQQAEALKELLNRIGNVPESELAPDVRDLLNAMRARVVKTAPEAAAAPSGAQQQTAANHDAPPSAPGAQSAADLRGFNAQAISTIEQHFGDVRTALGRYYR